MNDIVRWRNRVGERADGRKLGEYLKYGYSDQAGGALGARQRAGLRGGCEGLDGNEVRNVLIAGQSERATGSV